MIYLTVIILHTVPIKFHKKDLCIKDEDAHLNSFHLNRISQHQTRCLSSVKIDQGKRLIKYLNRKSEQNLHNRFTCTSNYAVSCYEIFYWNF
jgi:hypothetical protein